jgi:hypothetical protein
MSSSSSLSAARRRRVGGQQPVSSNRPEPPRQTQQQPSPIPIGNAPSPNPYMLLRQHHVKINELEKKINELSSEKNTEPTSTNVSSDTINSQIDATEFSDMIINRIESQLDLKAFYENDTRLAGEMEELHKIVQSQQLLINEMNTTLFHVIHQLHLQEPNDVDSAEPNDVDSTESLDVTEVADMLVNMKNNVTFETSSINYTGMEDEDDVSNYDGDMGDMGNMMTDDMTCIDPSSNVVDTSNNV